MSLRGARCVVTGASSGVGKAIAAELAARGAAVLGVARRLAGAAAIPPPGQVGETGCDVTDDAAVAALFAGLDRVDLLVCAAGGGVFGPAAGARAGELRAMLEAHVTGTFLCVRAALAPMAAGGRVVVIGSTATRFTFSDSALYTAAKSGQDALARALAQELRPRGIYVTRVHLGAVDTPLWDGRPGFDRAAMLTPAAAARAIVDCVAHPDTVADELLLRPPTGNV